VLERLHEGIIAVAEAVLETTPLEVDGEFDNSGSDSEASEGASTLASEAIHDKWLDAETDPTPEIKSDYKRRQAILEEQHNDNGEEPKSLRKAFAWWSESDIDAILATFRQYLQRPELHDLIAATIHAARIHSDTGQRAASAVLKAIDDDIAEQ
jgi:hypothetical protein